jgi:DNA mismatch repair ATPase MutS
VAKAPIDTPLIKQYFDIKAKHPDAVLLFRVGDFYEMYGEDAVAGAEILGSFRPEKPMETVHSSKWLDFHIML